MTPSARFADCAMWADVSCMCRDGGEEGEIAIEELPALEKAVSSISDPFKDQPLSPSKGVTVSEEQIGADEARQIIVASQKMYAEQFPDRAALQAKEVSGWGIADTPFCSAAWGC